MAVSEEMKLTFSQSTVEQTALAWLDIFGRNCTCNHGIGEVAFSIYIRRKCIPRLIFGELRMRGIERLIGQVF
jgi:hypothetical protein